jgi:hypothetical protein
MPAWRSVIDARYRLLGTRYSILCVRYSMPCSQCAVEARSGRWRYCKRWKKAREYTKYEGCEEDDRGKAR